MERTRQWYYKDDVSFHFVCFWGMTAHFWHTYSALLTCVSTCLLSLEVCNCRWNWIKLSIVPLICQILFGGGYCEREVRKTSFPLYLHCSYSIHSWIRSKGKIERLVHSFLLYCCCHIMIFEILSLVIPMLNQCMLHGKLRCWIVCHHASGVCQIENAPFYQNFLKNGMGRTCVHVRTLGKCMLLGW